MKWTCYILPAILALGGLACVIGLGLSASRDYAAIAREAATTSPAQVGEGAIEAAGESTPPAVASPMDAWTGRAFGFVMGLASIGLAVVMIGRQRKGGAHYWGMVGALGLAALATGAYSHRPDAPKTAAAKDIPLIIGPWIGEDLGVDPKTKEILGTDDIIMRSYTRGLGRREDRDRVVLAVIFARGKRKVAHPPEQCYAAQGFEMLTIEPSTFTTQEGPVNVQHLLISKGRSQQVIYWYKAGDLNTPSFLGMQMKVILSSLLMEPPMRVGLIRLSSTINGGPDAKAEALQRVKEFAQRVFPEIEKRLNPAKHRDTARAES
jgi:EpsI family protein